MPVVPAPASSPAPSTDARRSLGQRGEDLAAAHLESLGWVLLDRNWRCRWGELDCVALDPGESGLATLVFCEVKTRGGTGFGTPLESITVAKQARLRRLAGCWLADHPRRAGTAVRLDAIGIVLRRGWAPQIEHVRGWGA